MDKPRSGSESGAPTAYNTVFLDTNLDTHLAMVVSDSDTVSDLKNKIVEEHPLCFPSIGEIKVHALKVKRRGFFYYLSDLMSVRSAFQGVSKSWFLFVDASSVNGQNEIMHSCKPDSRNLAACVDIANNNSSADVVDLLPDGPSRRLSNVDDSLLQQVVDKHREKQNPIPEQFCLGNSGDEVPTSGNSSDEVPRVLQKKVEMLGYNHFKDLLCPTSNESVPQLQDKYDALGKEFEDPRTHTALKEGSVAKKKHKTKKRNEDAGQDSAAKENDLLVLESVDNASKLDNIVPENSFRSAGKDVSYNMSEENQRIGSFKTNTEIGTGMDTTSLPCEEIQVQQKHIECENDKPENGVIGKPKFKSPEESPESGPPAKKKHKIKKTSDNDISLTAYEASISDAVKRTSIQQEMTTSNYSLGEKLGSRIAISDNTELLEDNLKLTTGTASSRKRKRKEQISNPSQVVGAISSEKDEETNKIPFSAESDIINTGVGNVGRKNEVADLEAGPVTDKNVLVDQCANLVEDHPSPMIQEVNNLQENKVSSHENQTFAGEDGTVDPRKSSRKKKKSRKTVEVSTPSETGHVEGPVNDVSLTKLPKSVNDNVMGNIGVGNGESPNEEAGLEVMPVKDKTILMNQHAHHVKGHSSPTNHGLNNLQENMVSGHENKTVAAEDGTMDPWKSSKKKKMSRKTQGPDLVTSTPINENNMSSSGVVVGERKNETADLEAVPEILVDQQASNVNGHPSPIVLKEPNNLCESGVVGPENLLVSVVDKTVEAGKSSRKREKSRKTQGSNVETSRTSGTEHLRESNTDIVYKESKNYAADVDAVPVKDMNMVVDQHAIHHVEDHSYQQESNHLWESTVTQPENLTVAVEAGKSSRKKKKSRKSQGPDEETSLASGTEHLRESNTGIDNGESKNYAADVDAVPVMDTNMLVDQHASHVEDHSSLQEPNNLPKSRATGPENLTVAVEDETVEAGKSSRKRSKSRKIRDPDAETSVASRTEHPRKSLGDVSPTDPPISENGENLSDKAEKGGSTELKEASKIKTVSATPTDDKGADEVIRDVLESLQQCNKDTVNQDMDKKSKKKTKKKKSSTLVENLETKGKDELDHYNPKASTDSLMDQEVHDGNKSINDACEDKRIENQHQHEAIASSEKLACIVTDKKAADDKVNGPGLQSTGPSLDLHHSVKSSENHISGGNAQVVSCEPIQNQISSLKNVNESDSLMLQSNKKLPSISGNGEKLMKSNESEKLNTPQEAQTPILTDSSSRIKTKLKFAASTSASESSKSLVPQNRSANTHESHLPVRKAQRNDIGEVVDSSELKRGLIATSGTIDERGHKSRSNVAVRKTQRNNNGVLVNGSDRKRSLLAASGTIFKDDGKESSDDEDKTDNSDSSARTPNKSSSSKSSDSDADSSSSEHGSYSSKGEGGGGRNKTKSLPLSPKSLSLEAILRSSSRYKKAKLTFSQSQYDDIDSQPDEFVPDSQTK